MDTKDLTSAKSSNSLTKILGICLLVATVAFAAIWILKISPTSLLFAGTLLLCPLLHIFMMRGGEHKH